MITLESERTRIFTVRQNKVNRLPQAPIIFIRQSIVLHETVNRYCISIGTEPVNMWLYLSIGQLLCNFQS